MKSRGRLYTKPRVRMVTAYAECSGIGIGSGDTSPEDCETNNSVFEEDEATKPKSVWDS